MLTSTPHTHNPKPGFRRPLQPKNIILLSPPHPTKPPLKCLNNDYKEANKENLRVASTPIESIDVSLAEELSAVREKMERLRLDKEKTDKMLDERSKLIEFRLYEFIERGELQRELEIEVDRLFRLKQLHISSMSINKTEESPSMSFESSAASTSSASISKSTIKSTASSKMSLFKPRLSLQCASMK